MDVKKISEHINTLCGYIAQHRLDDAFKKLYKLIKKEQALSILKEQVDKQADIYKYLLMYSFAEVKDPDRDKVYSKLLRSLYKIADSAKYLLLSSQNTLSLNYIRKQANTSFLSEQSKIEQDFLNSEYSEYIGIIFNKYWLSSNFDDNDIEFVQKVISKDDISWLHESVMVSAISIGLLTNFNAKKLRLLFDFYYKGTNKVWQRAIVGIVFCMSKYSERLKEYPDLINEIELLSKDNDFMLNLQYVIIQLIKTKDTQKISQKLHNEILPEVAKFKPRIEERLRLDDIIDAISEDKNPDWEEVFGDSPEFLSKLEELSQMQIEGSDVFMATFSMLKHFSFFKEPVNWFIPFYKENKSIEVEDLNKIEGINSSSFIEGLENAAFLCNSDKYSFVLNIQEMPEMQQTMLLEMFQSELEGMNEMVKDDKILNQSALDKYQINQYVQDLYRFYKLYEHKDNFEDIFDENLEIYKNNVMLDGWFSIDLFKNIAGLYFKGEYYNDAINTYQILIREGFNEQIAYEQIAYSYQKLQDFGNALLYYKKSELFEKNLKWLTKKIALCYRELNQNEEAIEYYKKAEVNEPESLYIQANLGHSYLIIRDYENALKHYFKVEYFSPSNKLIQRPIAWCSFALGKFETSINYYTKLMEQNQADWKDYINYGHVLWCSGSTEKAIAAYKKSIELCNEPKQEIRNTFLEDNLFLIKYGISKFDIELMIDYMFIKIP